MAVLLEILPDLVPHMPLSQRSIANMMTENIAANLPSKTAQLNELAQRCLDSMIINMDNIALFQPFCAVVKKGIVLQMTYLLPRLAEIYHRCFGSKERLARIYIVPTLKYLLQSSRTNVAVSRLTQSFTDDLVNYVGKEALWSFADNLNNNERVMFRNLLINFQESLNEICPPTLYVCVVDHLSKTAFASDLAAFAVKLTWHGFTDPLRDSSN
ncbi:unnamed protein product [Soboliphyme baturini]|uniref:FAT domain-containing protein n=1 Tax=Soboliphyme baturini TaxID=241478 RepID=A0A183IWE1_9BILA|nr:unnamed protein product [Soboliphyme baturini]